MISAYAPNCKIHVFTAMPAVTAFLAARRRLFITASGTPSL